MTVCYILMLFILTNVVKLFKLQGFSCCKVDLLGKTLTSFLWGNGHVLATHTVLLVIKI